MSPLQTSPGIPPKTSRNLSSLRSFAFSCGQFSLGCSFAALWFCTAKVSNHAIPGRFLPQRNAKNAEIRTYVVFLCDPCVLLRPFHFGCGSVAPGLLRFFAAILSARRCSMPRTSNDYHGFQDFTDRGKGKIGRIMAGQNHILVGKKTRGKGRTLPADNGADGRRWDGKNADALFIGMNPCPP